MITKKLVYGILAVIVIIGGLCCIPQVFEDVNNEEIVINQALWSGKMSYWTDPGLKMQNFGRNSKYFKTRQLWFTNAPEKHTYNDGALPIVFNDGGNGRLNGSLRVKLPLDQAHLAKIQTDYGSMDRLMNELVRPTAAKVVYASGPLLSSYESYAEKKNNLIAYITDQLESGVYKTVTKEVKVIDEVSGEEQVRRVAETVSDSLSPKGLKRQELSPFAEYGLEIAQVSLSEINYDERVLEQIKVQQDANMKIQSARIEALKAKQDAVTAEESGKAAAATAKWEQEKIKATEVTKAQQAYEVAALQAKQAKEVAEKTIQEGRAEAEIARLKVAAGLSPLEAATIKKETAIGIAEALSNSKVSWVPTIMTGGTGNSQSTALDAVGLKMVYDLVDKIQK